MPKFTICWKKIYSNEWNNPPELQTDSGNLFVEASSLSVVQEEVKKYEGKECSMDERVCIYGIAEHSGSEQAMPLDAIRTLMDPWGCSREQVFSVTVYR